MTERSSPFSEGVVPALTYFGYRTAAWVAEKLPIEVGNTVGRVAAAGAFWLLGNKRKVVGGNLARVVGSGGELNGTVREAFNSYSRYWLETFRAGRYDANQLIGMVDCEDLQVIDAALQEGNGLVIVTAHFGFYDVGVAWLGALGYEFTTVAEVLKPRALFDWFASTRQRRGMRVLPSKPREITRAELRRTLENGGALALPAERDLSRRGVWVEFFGERTTFPAGPSVLLNETGAALLAGGFFQEGERYRARFWRVPYERVGDSNDVTPIAQRIATSLEDLIRIAPEQWHIFNSNWPSDEAHLPPRGQNN